MGVKGIERVRTRVGQVFADIRKDKTRDALYAILSEGSAVAATITPVDTSFLVNSMTKPQISGTSGSVGYMAEYAKWVHAMSGKLKGQPRGDFGTTRSGTSFGGGTGKGRYWDPNGEPQFLTKGFDRIKPGIPKILEQIYRV